MQVLPVPVSGHGHRAAGLGIPTGQPAPHSTTLPAVLSASSDCPHHLLASSLPACLPFWQEMLTSRGVNWQEVSDLREVAADVDVLYQTRIQKERFTNLDDYAKV